MRGIISDEKYIWQGINRNPFDLGLGTSSKAKSERDSRRTFTQSQKNEILYQQDSKCAVCHKKLDPRDIEYDHKKAWAANGRTVTQNGRAVHGSCHNIITHNQRLKKSDKKETKTKKQNTDIFGFPEYKPPKIKLF